MTIYEITSNSNLFIINGLVFPKIPLSLRLPLGLGVPAPASKPPAA